MYCRVKYAIRAIWIPRCRAVIIAAPSPLDGIARVNVYGAGTEAMGIIWSDCHIRRRGKGEDWKKQSDESEQPRQSPRKVLE